jgi:hypothetical protein
VTQSDRRLLSLLFLSLGVLISYGNFSSPALVCVILSLGAGLHSLYERPWGPTLPRWAGIAVVLALAGTTLLYFNRFGNVVFLLTFVPLAAAILLYSVAKKRVIQAVAFALAGLSAVAAVVANITWGFADIDVFHFQQDASQALLHGQNPYSPLVLSRKAVAPAIPTFENLHLPYGPILAVLEAPFRLLGDIRLLHIAAALIISVAVLTLARRAGTLERSACVVMAFPLTIGMILFSWVDVITMAGLAVWLVSFRSHPKVAIIALALALGAKPTTLIALVPIFFWSTRARRQVRFAGIIAALIVLPFAMITGFAQFYYNVLGVQLNDPSRLDSLTVNSFLYSVHLSLLPSSVSALVIAATTVLVLRRRPSSYGELLTGTAILATVSFLVAKWAYFNYYYIPAVLLMLAIAGNTLAVDVPEMISPPALFLRVVDFLRGARRRLPSGGRLRAPGIAAHDGRDTLA